MKSNDLLVLSEQQVVDCDKEMDGCQGGLSSAAYKYLERTGSELESDYPYKAKDGTCKAELHKQ